MELDDLITEFIWLPEYILYGVVVTIGVLLFWNHSRSEIPTYSKLVVGLRVFIFSYSILILTFTRFDADMIVSCLGGFFGLYVIPALATLDLISSVWLLYKSKAQQFNSKNHVITSFVLVLFLYIFAALLGIRSIGLCIGSV